MRKIISSKIFKQFLSKVPIIALLLITISTNYYHFFNDSYSSVYALISYMSGFSLLSLPAYFYIAYKHNFCAYSKIALWGMTFYVCLNICRVVALQFFNIDEGFYSNIFEGSVLTVFSVLSIAHINK